LSKIPNNINNIEQKLKSKTIIDSKTGCWLFQGGKDTSGAGQIQFNYKGCLVHRISAMLYLGFNMEGPFQVNHKVICPNRHCWNPEHLYIGTQSDNMQDRNITGTGLEFRWNKMQCINGHEYNEENTHFDKNGRKHCRICAHKAEGYTTWHGKPI
jgi:hypothetical protein